MLNEKTYPVTKEQFLALKNKQKEIMLSGKIKKIDYKNYVKARREFYHSKGMTIPNPVYWDNKRPVMERYVNADKENGFKYNWKEDYPMFDVHEARYFNIIYGLIKCHNYKQIENKVHHDNKVSIFLLVKFCNKYKKYGIDYEYIRKQIDNYDIQ